MTVVVFSDFQCAACGVFAAEVLPRLQADFMDAGIVRMAYRHYPLGGKDSVRGRRAGMRWSAGQVLEDA